MTTVPPSIPYSAATAALYGILAEITAAPFDLARAMARLVDIYDDPVVPERCRMCGWLRGSNPDCYGAVAEDTVGIDAPNYPPGWYQSPLSMCEDAYIRAQAWLWDDCPI